MKIIHVAGTNGKGSVCNYLESICLAAGYSTGLFISPHLSDIRERLRLNGQMIPEEVRYPGTPAPERADDPGGGFYRNL